MMVEGGRKFMFNPFKKNHYSKNIIIQVDDTERRIIVRALADLRDKQRMKHKNYDFLDSLIVKVCDAEISNPQKDCITR